MVSWHVTIFFYFPWFQWEIEAGLEPLSRLSKVLKSKLYGKYKQTSTPPGVAKRNSWGPILFKHCRVQYNKETKKLELMKGEFVGKYKTRTVSHVKDRKCEVVFNDDDDDDDVVEDDDVEDDAVDNNDPVDVVSDNILPGLCFLF